MSTCLNLCAAGDAYAAECCHAAFLLNTVAEKLFSGFRSPFLVCLCLVYNLYYTCVFCTLTLRSCCIFWGACRPQAVICHQKLPVFYRRDCGWMKPKRQSEAGLSRIVSGPPTGLVSMVWRAVWWARYRSCRRSTWLWKRGCFLTGSSWPNCGETTVGTGVWVSEKTKGLKIDLGGHRWVGRTR